MCVCAVCVYINGDQKKMSKKRCIVQMRELFCCCYPQESKRSERAEKRYDNVVLQGTSRHLSRQDLETLLDSDTLTGELVVRRETCWVSRLGGHALGINLLLKPIQISMLSIEILASFKKVH